MSFELTPNGCSLLQQHNSLAEAEGSDSKPVLQILSVKRVNVGAPNNQPDRIRMIVSDGTHFTQAMLATQLNGMVESRAFDKHVIVRIDKFVCNLVQNKRLVIILDATVLGTAEDKIGNPESMENALASVAAASTSSGSSAAAVTGNASRPAAHYVAPSRPPNGATVYPIEGLSPYQNKWTIKARITNKSDIKHWSNQKGEGKLFSCTMMDETGEIRGTAFNQQVDELYEKLQEGRVYYISKARVGLAKKQFSHIANEYEITFERNTEVELCPDADGVPEVKYNFVDLGALEGLNKDATCDVIGIVTEVGEVSEIIAKATQRSVPKRELTIADKSGFSCRLTLWGRSGETFQAEDQPVIAFKGVRVGDFGGRSLSFQSSSTMMINPDIPEAHTLRGWYESIGHNMSYKTHSSGGAGMSSGGGALNRTEMKTIAQVKDENLGMGEKQDYFTTRATVVHLKQEGLTYPACGGENCNKKVVDIGTGWECGSCGITYPEPQHRYMLSFSVADYTGQAWFSAFNDIGETMFGMKAQELIALKDEDENLYSSAIHKVLCQHYNFACRAKADNFNDRTQVRYNITRLHQLDYKAESRMMLESIKSYY